LKLPGRISLVAYGRGARPNPRLPFRQFRPCLAALCQDVLQAAGVQDAQAPAFQGRGVGGGDAILRPAGERIKPALRLAQQQRPCLPDGLFARLPGGPPAAIAVSRLLLVSPACS
jgi:hypothetical protein